MASYIKLYTTGNMEMAHAHNSPPEATGHPIELALDNNLDTYWKSTSTATVEVEIDLGEAKIVHCALLFIKNYKEITAGTFTRYWSDNGTAWTIVGGESLSDTSTPIRISMTGGGLTHRYWKLKITTPSHVVELAGVWWAYYYNVGKGNVLPQEDEDQFHGRASQLPGGRLAVAGFNRNRVEGFRRRYLIKSGDADFTDLRNAFLDSRGVRHPLIMNEGSAQADARVVRFVYDIFVNRLATLQVYDAQMSLGGVPYIDDGDSY